MDIDTVNFPGHYSTEAANIFPGHSIEGKNICPGHFMMIIFDRY